MKFTIKKEGVVAPLRKTFGSAGYDLSASEDVTIGPGEVSIVGTGIGTQLDAGFVAYICSRSGLAAKSAVIVLNAPGIIDEDYDQEIKVILMNLGVNPVRVNKGDRIAQLVLSRYETGLDSGSEEFLKRDGGFGSTGIK